MSGNALDFSFSGVKTAVLYHLREHPELNAEIEARREDLATGKRTCGATASDVQRAHAKFDCEFSEESCE